MNDNITFILSIVEAVLVIISEVLPFLNISSNGIIHALYSSIHPQKASEKTQPEDSSSEEESPLPFGPIII